MRASRLGTITMHIAEINSMAALDALRDPWLALHARDSGATVFASWPWLRGWAGQSPYPWSVLTARNDAGELTGVFPISPRGSRAAHRIDQLREIHTMGDPAADYRGFVCAPEVESQVIDAFADHLAEDRNWDRLILKDMLDARLPRFLERLRQLDPGAQVEDHEGNQCPILELPDTWERYLDECLTHESKRSLKKQLNRAAEIGMRLTTLSDSPPNGAAKQIDILLEMAAKRGRNGPEHLQRSRAILESCIPHRCAEVFVLWLNNEHGVSEPAAAQASFIDQHARSIGHYLTGYDERFAKRSPGRLMDALCVQWAMARGLKAVDFLRGDEAYKHQLGARPRTTRHVFITRRGMAQSLRGAISGLRERLGR